MNDRLLLPEEELLLAAADAPVLSPGFRSRALAEAVEARARRSFGRRLLQVCAALLLLTGLAAWRIPLLAAGSDLLQPSTVAADESAYPSDRPALNVSRRYGRGELLLSTGGNDWQLVEAEMISRREGLRCLTLAEQ